MAHAQPSRVRETSTTTGTGTYTLAGAVTAYEAFSAAMSNADTVDYCVTMGANWEIGRGTYSAGTLARTTILASSNADAAVNWVAGTKDVFAVMAGLSNQDATGKSNWSTLLGLGAIAISDAVYGAGWNGDTGTGASKNAIYDEMELRAPKANATFTGTFAIAAGALSLAGLATAAANSLLGRAATGTGVRADIAGTTVGHVLRVAAGPTLAFGALDLADTAAVTGVLPAANHPTASTTAAGIVTELATAAEVRTGTDTGRVPAVDQLWAAYAEVTLTDAATIAVNLSTFINAVVTLAGNRAMGNPTNEKVGQTGCIRIVQDATGSRTLTYGTDWEFAGGSAPTLSTTAAAQDLLFYQVIATDRVFASLVKAIA